MSMCDPLRKPTHDGSLSRRSFLKVPAAVAVAGLLADGPCNSPVRADALTGEQRDKMTPDEIIAEMKSGNARVRRGEASKRDFLAEQRASSKGQYPAAVILSCIDSRAPVEIIMDLSLGFALNCRVAGNVLNDDILGSMEFACKAAGAKVILVVGHTSCGAIMGGIDNVKLGHLTTLLAKIRPAVNATEFTGERTSTNPAFVDAVARKNVVLTMAQVLETSPVLRELHSKRAIKVAGALYNLETASVDFFA
jgi:carbonic anhydrase